MAAKKPGIRKQAPRSSKVVPITPRELRQIVPITHDGKPQIPTPDEPDRLREKVARWLESTFIPWLRRA